MRRVPLVLLFLLAALVRVNLCATKKHTPCAPLRGWNSYLSTGGSVDEATLLSAADFMEARRRRAKRVCKRKATTPRHGQGFAFLTLRAQAHLKPFGYDLLVLDEGWSESGGA